MLKKRLFSVLLLLFLGFAPVQAEPVLKKTVLGTYYQVSPEFEPQLSAVIGRIRAQLRQERAQGKLIGFVSIPLSSRGGGNRDLNAEVSEFIKARLESRFGADHFWALAPGLVESTLVPVDGRRAQGGDYMYMWTQILAGEQGLGEDFDLVYFAGPDDFARKFGLTGLDDLGTLKKFLDARASTDHAFAESVKSPEQRLAFLRYYALRVSSTFSTGAHDEWNLFRRVNQNRRRAFGIGDQLPLYFDGRQVPPGAVEAPLSPGYERL